MRRFHYDCHQRNHAITANVTVCRVTFRGYRYAPSWMGHLLRRYVYRYRDSKHRNRQWRRVLARGLIASANGQLARQSIEQKIVDGRRSPQTDALNCAM